MRCGKGKDPRVADDETFVSDSQIPLSFPPSAHQLVFFSFLPTGTKIIGWWKEKKSWWLAVGLPAFLLITISHSTNKEMVIQRKRQAENIVFIIPQGLIHIKTGL
jgi:hypothetical protein